MDLDQTEWYDEIDINSISLVGYYKPLSIHNEVYNEVEVLNLPDEATFQHNNFEPLFKLEDPYRFQMYDVPCVQMDGSAKCTVTNNINLLKDVRWYNQFFQPKARMKVAISDNIIIPHAEGYLQVPTIQEGKCIDVQCYYSQDFTSTLFI